MFNVEVKHDTLRSYTMDRINRKLLLLTLFFTVFAVLLTWPLLIEPDKIYITTDLTPDDSMNNPSDYLSDHRIHMDYAVDSGERILNGDNPLVVPPDYALPQTYVLTGGIFSIITPFTITVFHNLYFLLSIILSGLFTYFLVEDLFTDRETALFAGILYMSSFYIFNEYLLGHTNQWQLQWLPLILFALERVISHATRRNILLLGIAFALQTLSSTQYALYLSLMLPVYLAIRYITGNKSIQEIIFWKRFGSATVFALYLSWPYIMARQSSGSETYPKARTEYAGYTLENLRDLFFATSTPPQYYFRLSLFTIGILLLLFGARRIRKQLIPFAAFALIGFLFTLGSFASWAPYALFYDYWPMARYFRIPYRMFPFVALGTSVISASTLLYISNQESTYRGIMLVVLLAIIQIAIAQSTLQFTGIIP